MINITMEIDECLDGEKKSKRKNEWLIFRKRKGIRIEKNALSSKKILWTNEKTKRNGWKANDFIGNVFFSGKTNLTSVWLIFLRQSVSDKNLK